MSDSQTLATPAGLVTVVSKPVTRRWWQRRPEPNAAHLGFLTDHWLELSAAAYRGYLRHGAGAVAVIDHADEDTWASRLVYTTQIHTLPGATEADFEGWPAHQLETYDPESEALTVFAGDAVTGYVLRGSVPPPEALRVASAPLN